jgi:hypothetical protein
VQLALTHSQPLPAIDTSVKPEGTVSVTVTVPIVGPESAASDTVTVYVAPCWPNAKSPTCVFVTLRTGALAMIEVESVALAVAELPPETVTLLICGEMAAGVTFTVAVMGG